MSVQPHPAPRPRLWWCYVALIIAGVGPFLRTLDAPFVFDDVPAIVRNESIRDLSQLGRVLQPPAGGTNVAGRPLANLSFALNYAVGGLDPRGYHAVNIGLHVLCALTLFGLLRRLFALELVPSRLRPHAGSMAFLTTLLWTVHPLQTETVICAVQRTEAIVTLCYLATFYCFLRAATAERPRRWFAGTLIACAAGMASKEVMVSAPLVLFFFDRTFVAGSFAEAWRRRGRWHLSMAATWVVLVYLVVVAGGQRGESAGLGLGVSSWTYLLTQAKAIAIYLKLTFWPHPLIADYGMWMARGVSDVAPEFVLLTALAIITAFALYRWPRAGFAGLVFFAVLAPSSSVVPILTQTMAEHRMYLPLAAVLALVVVGAFAVRPRVALVGGLALAIGATTLTIRRGADYATPMALWSDLVRHQPNNPWGLMHLGYELIMAQRFAEAEPLERRALELLPEHPNPLISLGIVLTKLDRPREAIPYLARAVVVDPQNAQAHFRYGLALLAAGQPADAIPQFAEAVRLAPPYPDAEGNWGVALFHLQRFAEAVPHFEKLLAVQPDTPDVRFNLALALIQLQRTQEAVPHLQALVRLNPDSAEGHELLANILVNLGRGAEAAEHYETTLRLKPGRPVVHYNLGIVFAQLGRVDEAKRQLAEARRLDPTFEPARVALERLGAGSP